MRKGEKKEANKPRPVINALECKACERCVLACPAKALNMSTGLNERGYRYVVYAGSGCTGCGSCYYTCPEPNALEVHIPQTGKKEEH